MDFEFAWVWLLLFQIMATAVNITLSRRMAVLGTDLKISVRVAKVTGLIFQGGNLVRAMAPR